jgi:hypothetical protein
MRNCEFAPLKPDRPRLCYFRLFSHCANLGANLAEEKAIFADFRTAEKIANSATARPRVHKFAFSQIRRD